MDNSLPNINENTPVWRCVDWSTEKAQDRFLKGKNRYDPYIYDFVLATNGIYTPGEQLVLDGTDKRPCVFRGLGKSPSIKECIKQNIDYMYIDTGYFGNEVTKKCFLVHEPILKSVVRKPALVRLAEEEVPVRCDLVVHAVPDQQGQREEELGEQGKRDAEALGDLEDCLRLHVGLILLHQDDGADVVPAPSAPLQQFLARPGLQGGHPEEKESEVRSEKNSEARRRRLT